LSGNLVSESNIRKMAAGDYNGITKEWVSGFSGLASFLLSV